MLEKIKKLLLYGGTSSQTYKEIFPDITESNRINMTVFSSIAVVGMLLMTLGSFMDASLEKNRSAYLACVIVAFILAFLDMKVAKGRAWLVYTSLYIFLGLMFGFGIALGTLVEPNQMTVSFAIMLFAVPLLFTDKPVRMNLAILIGILVYLFAAVKTQNQTIFWYNLTNIVPYGLISMVVSSYMMQIKIRRHILEYENKYLIESDQMTGMLNRRCYEEHLVELRNNGLSPEIKICVMDLNGLKVVNDSLGHQLGDELIRGAADCIKKVFASYGKCYRTGGDEFVAILEGESPAQAELKERLSEVCQDFKKEGIPELSISIGIAEARDGKNIDLLVREADQKMYQYKSEYYRLRGNDRRKS